MATGTVLATVPSSSSSAVYEIRLGGDGNVYCTCPAWKFQKLPPKERTCKHMKALSGQIATMTKKLATPKAAPKSAPAPAVEAPKAAPVTVPVVTGLSATGAPVVEQVDAEIAALEAKLAALKAAKNEKLNAAKAKVEAAKAALAAAEAELAKVA